MALLGNVVRPFFAKSTIGIFASCLMFGAVGFSEIATAQQPASSKAPFTSADLILKNEHGPWLILATSFEGEGAMQKAVQLAAELRKEFGLTAYCMPKSFDYSKTIKGAGLSDDGNGIRMKYRNDRVIETCAVLIGDFHSIDGEIDTVLEKVKKLRPKYFANKAVTSDGSDSVSTIEYRNYLSSANAGSDAKSDPAAQGKPPMAFAFKTRNPLLPPEYYQSPEVDKFVKKMNQEKPFNEHNLLDCKKKFTVRVLTLRGTDSFASWGRSTSTDDESETLSQLELAAERAHLVTKTLRLAGYEAYQFHDRTQSIVCVGGFDSLGKEKSEGDFAYEPAILEVVKRFAGTGSFTKTKYGASERPHILLDDIVDSKIVPELKTKDVKKLKENFSKLTVAFDLVPTPIMIPKPQTTSIYSSYAVGK